jgi:PAS domain S-box-containing protein
VDLLLASAAGVYGERLVAVILSGEGTHGGEGAMAVRRAGGTVVVQDPETPRPGRMPGAIALEIADVVESIEGIGPTLVRLLQGEPNRERPASPELSDILESISDAFFALDAQGRFTYVNRKAERLWGRGRRELLGQRIWEAFPGAVGAEPCEAVERALKGGDGAEFESFSAMLGAWMSGRVYPAAGGGVSVYFRDVTDRKRHEAKAAFLAGLAEDFAGLSSPDEIMRAVGERIERHFGVSRLTFAEVDEAADEVTVVYDSREGDLVNAMGVQRLSEYMSEDVLRDMKASRVVAVDDVSTDPRTAACAETFATLRVRAQLFAPHVSAGRLGFVIALQHPEIREWSDGEIELLQELAARVYPRLERARGEEALRRAAEADAFRVALADALRPLADPVDIQSEAARVLGEHLGVDRAFYMDVEEDGELFVVRRDYHVPGVPSATGRYPVDGFGPTLMAEIRSGRTLAVADVGAEPVLTDKERAAYAAVGVLAYAGVPLVKGGRCVAVFGIHQTTPRAWMPDELALIEETAERTWAAVERARAEEALRESEERYRTLFETMEEGFCVVEMIFDAGGEPCDYRFEQTNPAFEKHTGLVGAEGKTARELVPDLEARWIEHYGRVASTGEPVRFVDGSEAMGRWFDVHAFRLGAGGSRRVAILFNDITERRRTEEERERFRRGAEGKQARLEAIMRQMPGGVFIADLDGRPILANEGTEQVYGRRVRSVEECVLSARSYPEGEPIPPEDYPLNRALAGESVSGVEHYVLRPDGTRAIVRANAAPARDGEGRVVAAVKVFDDVTRQKEAEEALRANEERTRLATEAAQMFTWEVDLTTEEVRYSPNADQVMGFALPTNVAEVIALATDEDRDDAAETYRRALAGEVDLDEEYHVVAPEGGENVWIRIRGILVGGSRGEARRFLGITQNITERKRAEERLRESKERYRTLVSNFPGAVYRCEWRGEPTMVFVSEKIEAITGYPQEDFLENRVRSFGSIIHPEDRPGLDEQVTGALMREEPYALEYRIRHADGSVRWINERGTGIFSEDGSLLYLDGAIFDVTQREEARRALRESEERLRAVVDNAPIILCAMDREGVFRLAEGRGHETLGIEPGSVVGQSVFEVFREFPEVRWDARRALAGESFTAVREVNGALWESTYTPSRDEAGRSAGAIAVATDVTQRKRAEEARNRLRAREWVARAEAGERERISRELHDRVAHQMGVVHQSLELYAALKGRTPDRAAERLALAREMAKASLDATRNLSAELRRSEAEEGLEPALADLLDAFRRPNFKPELSVRGDEDVLPPHVRGQVYVILREAVRNAARHSGGRGVSVEVEISPEEIIGSVQDDGMGFEGAGTAEGNMGLRSMKERAALLGGSLHVDSDGDSGTRVEVRVPLNGRLDRRGRIGQGER